MGQLAPFGPTWHLFRSRRASTSTKQAAPLPRPFRNTRRPRRVWNLTLQSHTISVVNMIVDVLIKRKLHVMYIAAHVCVALNRVLFQCRPAELQYNIMLYGSLAVTVIGKRCCMLSTAIRSPRGGADYISIDLCLVKHRVQHRLCT